MNNYCIIVSFLWRILFLKFYFPITVDIQCYITFRGSTAARHFCNLVIPQVTLVPTQYRTRLLQHYWLHSLCRTLRPRDYCVTTNLYFSIPSPFSPSSPTYLSNYCFWKCVSAMYVCVCACTHIHWITVSTIFLTVTHCQSHFFLHFYSVSS